MVGESSFRHISRQIHHNPELIFWLSFTTHPFQRAVLKFCEGSSTFTDNTHPRNKETWQGAVSIFLGVTKNVFQCKHLEFPKEQPTGNIIYPWSHPIPRLHLLWLCSLAPPGTARTTPTRATTQPHQPRPHCPPHGKDPPGSSTSDAAIQKELHNQNLCCVTWPASL